MAWWRRDRIVALGGLVAVIALSWAYLARMSHMSTSGMVGAPAEQFAAAFLVWAVMMVAMMLPTAVPAIDVFGSFARKRVSAIGSAPATSLFVLGYVAVWTAYAAIAAAGQVVVSRATLLAPALHSSSVVLSVAVLLLAGAFQLTSFKDACLTHCRSPFPFFLAR